MTDDYRNHIDCDCERCVMASEIEQLRKQVFDGLNDAWALETDQLKAECLRLQADLGHGRDERAKLREKLAAAEARLAGGTCRILSGKCDCTLCKQDAKIAELSEKVGELQRGVDAVWNLIEQSHGVDGLHMNGDVAPWSELLLGGKYEEWLRDLSSAAKVGGS